MHYKQNTDLKQMSEIFANYTDVDAAYLFGSFAKNANIDESDIDIGLVGNAKSISKEKINILADLAEKGFSEVDLVIFEKASLLLQYEIIRQNNLIYLKKDFDKGTLFSITLRKFWDFKPYLDVQRKAMKRRILNA